MSIGLHELVANASLLIEAVCVILVLLGARMDALHIRREGKDLEQERERIDREAVARKADKEIRPGRLSSG